ncbi:hypothetical protein [Streptomyces smyrnaeus]|uniref:hypothetical protein n=1 Tax=Streptomyces smyrnaeus TaxID=1387713 RepID=UPI00368C3C4F
MLTPEPVTIRAVPGPGFIAGCTVTTWLQPQSPAGPLALLLLGHAPARRPGETPESVETGLLGIVDALGLRPPADPLPDIGARLTLSGGMVALDIGHPAYSLRLPPTGRDWRAHLADGGAACLLIGLDPIPPGAGPDAIDAYVSRTTATDRARIGATRLRTSPHRPPWTAHPAPPAYPHRGEA